MTRICITGIVVSLSLAGCVSLAPPSSELSACPLATSSAPWPLTTGEGITLALPPDASGPVYDSDDYFRSRPTWFASAWRVHFVFGNGGLTEYMEDARCCALNDAEMNRTVCVGVYMGRGAMADIARVDSPDRVSSMHVTFERGGLSEEAALMIVASAVTTWEAP